MQGRAEGIDIKNVTTFGVENVSREGASRFCADIDVVPKGDLIMMIASTTNHIPCFTCRVPNPSTRGGIPCRSLPH